MHQPPPPLDTRIPHNSKKRAFARPGPFMDPEVVEIAPPVPRPPRELKQKEVVIHEIIDIDNDDDSPDVMVIEKKVDSVKKGKAVIDVDDGYCNGNVKDASSPHVPSFNGNSGGSLNGNHPFESLDLDSHSLVNLDGQIYDISSYEDDYMDFCFDESLDADEYDVLQARFDNMDIPPGVEAAIPWLSDLSKSENKFGAGSSSNGSAPIINTDPPSHLQEMESFGLTEPLQTQVNYNSVNGHGLPGQTTSLSHVPQLDMSTPYLFTQTGQNKKNRVPSQRRGIAKGFPFGLESFKARRLFEPFRNKKMPAAPGSSSKSSSVNKFDTIKLPSGVEPPPWGEVINNGVHKSSGFSNPYPYNPGFTAQAGTYAHSPGSEVFDPWLMGNAKNVASQPFKPFVPFVEPFQPSVHILPKEEEDFKVPCDVIEGQENGFADDVIRKFQLFKQFDTVEDHSDHHYTSHSTAAKQPSKSWVKRIQEEWKILEKDLPDTIFVRVYETRIDLLRAVIIGAEGTPYHDGLFFFDVSFPSGYPNVPPNVYYHAGGLRLNPNLYACGKVCLSLLNTWSGQHKTEKWLPGVSTMLQVLVSIQGLILNAKPYFNEPGYARMSGSENGEKMSRKYNEDTFILSLRTMSYTMRKPPKHFEDLVVGHFFQHAQDILVACKAYMQGAQVGCLVKGGVQDVDEGDSSCSSKFKETLAGYIGILVKDFQRLGVKDLEKFLPPAPARKVNAKK